VLASGVPSLEDCDLRATPPARAGVAVGPASFPVAAVPTTLSGAELTAGFSIAIDPRNRKVSHAHPAARPVLVVHDAELLLGTPAPLLASSGMNALAHAVEHLTAPSCSPLSRAANLDGARTLFRALGRLAGMPHDLSALDGALLGSALAEVDYPNAPVGLAHALCHAVTGKTGIPHGLAYAVLLPRCMRFTAPAAPAAYADLRRALGTAGSPFEAIEGLREALALPNRLRDVGVARATLPDIAAATLLHYGARTNARPVGTVEQALDLLEGAW
jgi:alcohol dehydrogenase class IV